MKRLAASGRTQTEKITIVGKFFCSFFSCDVDSDRYALPVCIVNLQWRFLAVQNTLLVHQTSGRIAQSKKTVILRIHAVTVAGEGIDEQLQLVVSPFGYMDAHP